jgi:transglutaminase-like putative cysteine protease
MIVRIAHATTFVYDDPQRNGVVLLSVTPRDHEGQHVRFWRIEVDPAVRLREWEDHFGNTCHLFDLPGPFEHMTVSVEGEVDVQDVAGVVRGAPETFPPLFYLRETPLTLADENLMRFAETLGPLDDTLAWLHRLMSELKAALKSRAESAATKTAPEAFAAKRATSRDFSHIFIALARSRRLPARFVSGYLAKGEGVAVAEAGHAWAEVFVQNLGWVGFDPANDQSPTDAYVRVATALDSLGAAPIRAARQGGGAEKQGVRLQIDSAPFQSQS